MAWKCTICAVFITFTLKLLLRHIFTEHSTAPDFSITCNVGDCPQKYVKYNSFYKHVMREHRMTLNDRNPPRPCPYSVDTTTVDANSDNSDIEDGTPVLINHMQNIEPEERAGTNAESHTDSEMDIDEDDDSYKQHGLSFLMGLQQRHKIRETAIEEIAHGTNAMVGHYVDLLQRRVRRTLQQSDVDPAVVDNVTSKFDVDLPFAGLLTSHERMKFIKENYYYVAPEWVIAGREVTERRRQGRRHITVKNETFAYFPIQKSLEQLLQNEEICNLILDNDRHNNYPEGYFGNLSSGTIFRNHEVFISTPSGFQIILYCDDLEICNPLSKKAGKHKITLFYYTLGNIPLSYRSRLPAIRLVAVVKRKLINKHSINIVLNKIKNDLNNLKEGIYITTNNIQHLIKGACLCFVGDTLASNEFGGFKIGVGFAFLKCRECLATFEQIQTNFNVENFLPRTKEQHEQQCTEIQQAETLAMRDLLCTNYGINQRSVATEFPFFNVTQMIPHDIMHIVFEGAGVYEVKLALNKMTEMHSFTLQQLNELIENFEYGYKNRSSQPVPIPAKVFVSDETNLRQSASSMIVFMRLLPYFLIEKLHCNPDDEYVSFVVELCQIVLILMSSIVSQETVYVLKTLISGHLQKFKELFPTKNIIPKQHYLIHLPAAIERFGSLTNIWGMRFEAKHQFVKQKMNGTHNYQNVVKSVANSCAMYECSLNAYAKHPLFDRDLEFSKCLRMGDQDECKTIINAFFGTDVNQIQNVFEVKWVLFHGQKFVKNECEVCFGESDGIPEFGKVVSIWVSHELQNDEYEETDLTYFRLQMYETVCHNENINAFEVTEPTVAQGLELVYAGNLFVHTPMHVYEGRGRKKFIPATHDLIDLIRVKRGTQE